MSRVRINRWFRRLPAVLLAVLVANASYAQDEEIRETREGYFEIRSAQSQLIDGVHMLDARMQLVLSGEALEALSSGFTLTIELQLELIRVRRWYLDDVEAELATRYELNYHPLSQRYIVRNLNSGEQDSFATLYSALNNLGRVQRLPLIDDTLLEPDSDYRVRARALLQTRQYSAPIRMIFFWRGQWQLESEWFEWMLVR